MLLATHLRSADYHGCMPQTCIMSLVCLPRHTYDICFNDAVRRHTSVGWDVARLGAPLRPPLTLSKLGSSFSSRALVWDLPLRTPARHLPLGGSADYSGSNNSNSISKNKRNSKSNSSKNSISNYSNIQQRQTATSTATAAATATTSTTPTTQLQQQHQPQHQHQQTHYDQQQVQHQQQYSKNNYDIRQPHCLPTCPCTYLPTYLPTT